MSENYDNYSIPTRLKMCPLCEKPMHIINGLIPAGEKVTIWMDPDGHACVTPHEEGCEYEGKALPEDSLERQLDLLRRRWER